VPVEQELDAVREDAHTHEGDDDVVRTREQPDSDVDQGANVVAIVDLATRSIWEGAAFEFDPKTMTSRKV
jgi:hypothetical protein